MVGFSEPLCLVSGVRKKFGNVVAVDEVSFSVGLGEIVGIVGENGAGKSTLFSLISGINTPTSGRVSVAGLNPRDPRARRCIGVTPQSSGLDERAKVASFLKFVAEHFGTVDLLGSITRQFALESISHKLIGELSGGQQRLVAISAAFLSDAPLILLDEPTTGLDTSVRSHIWEAIKNAAGSGRSILVTSHYLEEIERLCSRILVMRKGQLVKDGSVEDISRSTAQSIITLTSLSVQDFHDLENVGRLVAGDMSHATFLVSDVPAFLSKLHAHSYPFDSISIAPPSLEQAFLVMEKEGNNNGSTN